MKRNYIPTLEPINICVHNIMATNKNSYSTIIYTAEIPIKNKWKQNNKPHGIVTLNTH